MDKQISKARITDTVDGMQETRPDWPRWMLRVECVIGILWAGSEIV